MIRKPPETMVHTHIRAHPPPIQSGSKEGGFAWNKEGRESHLPLHTWGDSQFASLLHPATVLKNTTSLNPEAMSDSASPRAPLFPRLPPTLYASRHLSLWIPISQSWLTQLSRNLPPKKTCRNILGCYPDIIIEDVQKSSTWRNWVFLSLELRPLKKVTRRNRIKTQTSEPTSFKRLHAHTWTRQ